MSQKVQAYVFRQTTESLQADRSPKSVDMISITPGQYYRELDCLAAGYTHVAVGVNFIKWHSNATKLFSVTTEVFDLEIIHV